MRGLLPGGALRCYCQGPHTHAQIDHTPALLPLPVLAVELAAIIHTVVNAPSYLDSVPEHCVDAQNVYITYNNLRTFTPAFYMDLVRFGTVKPFR